MAHFYADEAREKVKAVWIEQGIWLETWEEVPGDHPPYRWKHERSEDGPEANASRPFYQFLFQVRREHDAIVEEMGPAVLSDAGTKAYNVVKERWKAMSYWNEEWGILPGMMWLYEKPDPSSPLPMPAAHEKTNEADVGRTSNAAGIRKRSNKPARVQREGQRRSARLKAMGHDSLKQGE